MNQNFLQLVIGLVTLIALPIKSHAQCVPDPTINEIGVFPNLVPSGCVNEFFDQTITAVAPKDTVVNSPFGNLTIPIDSIQITSIAGLPNGLNFDCENADCKVYPELGAPFIKSCIRVSGTPTIAVTDLTVTINVMVWATVPFIGVISETTAYEVQVSIFNGGSNLLVLNTEDSTENSLRSIISRVCINDVINFDNGLLGDTIKLSGSELLLNKEFSIVGPLADDLFISGEGNSNVFNIGTEGIINLENLNLIEGNPTEGILLNNGQLNLKNVTLKEN